MSSRSPVTDKAARTAPPLPMKRRRISRRKSEDRDGGLHHAAEVDAFLGERLGFLGGRCRLRLEVGTLSRRQNGANVLAVCPRDASDPALGAVLDLLDMVLLIGSHDSRTQLTLTEAPFISNGTPPDNDFLK